MNRKNIMTAFLLWFCCLILVSGVQAATFCVSNGNELQTALSTASSNNQADHIKLKVGTYLAMPGTGNFYNGVQNHDLEISGRWGAFNNDECGRQIFTSGYSSISLLEKGRSTFSILTGSEGDVSISHVIIANGEVYDPGPDAGLTIRISDDYSGQVLVENNFLNNNLSKNGSALSINGLDLAEGSTVVVRNNIMSGNESNTPVDIDLKCNVGDGDTTGLYFLNNTVFDNDTYDNSSTIDSGVWIKVDKCSALIANNLLWDYAGGDNDLVLWGDGYKYLFNNNIGIIGGFITADEVVDNFSIEPVFESGFYNFHPVANSAEINAGLMPATTPHNPPWFDENWQLGALDYFGQARVNEGIVDVGAVESDLIFKDGFE